MDIDDRCKNAEDIRRRLFTFYEEKRKKKVKLDTRNINFELSFQPFPIEISEIYHYSSVEHFQCAEHYQSLTKSLNLDVLASDFRQKFIAHLFNQLRQRISDNHLCSLGCILHFLNEDRNKIFLSENEAHFLISERYVLCINHGFFELLSCILMQSLEILIQFGTLTESCAQFYSQVCNFACTIVLQILIFASSEYAETCTIKPRIEAFIINDETGKLLIDKLVEFMIKFTNPSYKYLYIKRYLILLRVLIIYTLGGFADSKRLRQKSRELYKLPVFHDYSNKQSTTRVDSDESCKKSNTLKIRRYELEYYLSNLYLSSCGLKPKYVSLEYKYEGCSDIKWHKFCQLKNNLYIPLYEAQCDAWEQYITKPKTNVRPPMPPSSLINKFYKAYLMDLKLVYSLSKLLYLCASRNKSKKSIFSFIELINKKSMSHSFTFEEEEDRHYEIIMKNVLQIYLILLEQLKSNHAYQYFNMVNMMISCKVNNSFPLLFSMDPRDFIEKINDYLELDLFSCLLATREINNDGIHEEKPTSTRALLLMIFFIRILIQMAKISHQTVNEIIPDSVMSFLSKLLIPSSSYMRYYVSKLVAVVFNSLPSGVSILIKSKVTHILQKYISFPYYYVRPDKFLDKNVVYARTYDLYDASQTGMKELIQIFNDYIISDTICYDILNPAFWISNSLNKIKRLEQLEKDQICS